MEVSSDLVKNPYPPTLTDTGAFERSVIPTRQRSKSSYSYLIVREKMVPC